MKKLLCLLLAAMMMLLCAAPALAEEPVWSINANLGTLKAKNRTKLDGHITVPAEVEGTKVLRLDYMCFSATDAVNGFTLPDTLRYFDRNTFQHMTEVSTLTLPGDLIIIKSGAMDGMDKLESLVIPPSVSLVHGAILNCESLKSVTFEGVCPVFPHDDNFATLHNLHPECVIYVPDDQLDAYKAAFADDEEVLARIQPSGKNATVIDWTAPESDFDFDAATGTVTAYKGTAGRVTIPSAIGGVTVRHIGKAFMQNYGLYYVTIPEGVETIGASAFRLCNGLNYAELPSTLKSIGDTAFNGCSALVSVAWAEGLETIGKDAFSSTDLRHVELPASILTIGENAFLKTYMKTLSFGGSLESIGASAFSTNQLYRIVYNGAALPQMDATVFEKNTKEAELILSEGCSAEAADGFTSYMATAFPTCVVKAPEVAAPAPAADAGAFIGRWNVAKCTSGGEEVPLSLIGMDSCYIQINEDGTGEMLMDSVMPVIWFMQDGMLMFGPSAEEAIPLTVDENGLLVLDMGDPILYYAKGEGAAAPAPAADAGAFIGRWDVAKCTSGGEEVPLELIGMDSCYIQINEDGTGEMLLDGVMSVVWFMQDGWLMIGPSAEEAIPLTVNEDGLLVLNMGDPILYYAKGEGAAAPQQVPALDPVAGADYIGRWNIARITDGSEEMPLELMGMDGCYILLNDDGTAEMLFEDLMAISWYMQDGVAYMGPSMDEMLGVAMDENGQLMLDLGGMYVYYIKEGASGMPALDESAAAFIGTWDGDTIEMNGEEFPLSMLMMQADMVLNDDGTALLTVFSRDMFDGDPTYWCVADGAVKIGPSMDVSFTMTLLEDGRLFYDMGDGTLIRFVKKEEAAPAVQLDPNEIGEQGVAQAALPVSAANPDSYLERKFVCIGATQYGNKIDPMYVPGTYVIFHENGLADASVYGAPSPNSPWMAGNMGGEDIIQLTFMGYSTLTLKFVEGGLDLDYMGTMTIHLAPEN